MVGARRTTVGFLHTADEHVATFARLLGRIAPPLRGAHLVDTALLEDAREHGVDTDVRSRLDDRLAELDDRGSGVIVCTCSTLGPHAERGAAVDGAPPVLRVDRAGAEHAADLARWRLGARGRLGLVATLATDAGATRALVDAEGVGADLEVVEELVPDGWLAVAVGEQERATAVVAQAVRELAPRVDVVLLAQVGTAAAADRLTDLRVPVVTTPRPAVLAAVEALRARERDSSS